METIIAQIGWNFIKNLQKVLSEGKKFSEIEKDVAAEVAQCAAEIVGIYVESVDKAIEMDKAGRRQAGYVIERRGDARRLLTQFGEVRFQHTYYKKAAGGYEYLADTALGIESRNRVSEGLGLSLANAASEMSYAKASRHAADEMVSRQTVMRRVRQSVVNESEVTGAQRVPELHIDADEAHLTMSGGKRSIVPLISVYEGIGQRGKRNFCKEVFHISEYGKTPDEIWEQALTEIERRYDLTGTRVYLHGDGGAWIQTGLEWLPKATFVLDKYHKNKAINAMTAGLDLLAKREFGSEIRKALYDEDLEFFEQLAGSLCVQMPERSGKIEENAGYLKKFVSGISVCASDPGANNGDCTEPHVSHVLSSRLSSRPMAWSRETLEKLAPILAAGRVDALGKTKTDAQRLPKPLRKTAASASKAFRKGALGLPTPDAVGRLNLSGKVTGTQKILKLFA